jgi:ATP-binding cassette subfamily F protein 3
MVRVSGLKLSFGSQVLFDDVNFTVGKGERIGLVGRNGSGKTSLFNILAGKLRGDEGSISFPREYRVGYAEQSLTFTGETALAEVCGGVTPVTTGGSPPRTAAPRDAAPGEPPAGDQPAAVSPPPVDLEGGGESWRAEKVLAGLGFSEEDMAKKPEDLSGGFQVRLQLAKVLLRPTDLLLLDEPTNYLDIVAIRWLARFLRAWPGELMLITHDRGFMDGVVTHAMIIHRGKVRKIRGGTGKLYEQIIKEEEIYEKTRLNDEKKRREVEVFINRFRAKARLASMVQSRIKTLEKRVELEQLEKIPTLEFSFNEAPFPAAVLMEVRNLSFSFDRTAAPLFQGLSFRVGKGDRIGVIGKNGRGKTTLLRIMNGELPPVRGEVLRHQELRVSCFGQTNVDRLYPAHTVEEEIFLANPDAGRKRVMDICGAVMFGGDAAFKKIAVLSGGEKSRVLLGKILASSANLLLLDEPSNHLDMESTDSLMAAIDSFGGAVVVVTHNETILRSMIERLVVFEDEAVKVFECGYEEFLERGGWGDAPEQRAVPRKGAAAGSAAASAPNGAAKDGNPQKTFRKARARVIADRSRELRPVEEGIGSLEIGIEELEIRSSEIHALMIEASGRGDGKAIQALSIERHSLQERISEGYRELERLLAKREEITALYEERLEEISTD